MVEEVDAMVAPVGSPHDEDRRVAGTDRGRARVRRSSSCRTSAASGTRS